jgi:nucleoid-associated protein YgaU
MKYGGLILFCCCLFIGSAFAEDPVWRFQENPEEYDTMHMESYEIALANALQREKTAKEAIAQEQAQIESLKQQLIDMDAKIAATIQEKYDILGITEQDVIDAENEIASIRQELELLLGLTPDELLRRIADIKKQEARIAALKAKPVSYLWRIRDQIIELENLLARVKANLPDKLSSYTVRLIPERRDCLYRIAEYDEIYGDPTQWPQIYRANKSQIDGGYNRYVKRVEEPKYSRAEDLIFPGQVLDIPR